MATEKKAPVNLTTEDLENLSKLMATLDDAKFARDQKKVIEGKIMDFFRQVGINTYHYGDILMRFTEERDTNQFDVEMLKTKYPEIWKECHSVNRRPPHLLIKKVAKKKNVDGEEDFIPPEDEETETVEGEPATDTSAVEAEDASVIETVDAEDFVPDENVPVDEPEENVYTTEGDPMFETETDVGGDCNGDCENCELECNVEKETSDNAPTTAPDTTNAAASDDMKQATDVTAQLHAMFDELGIGEEG